MSSGWTQLSPKPPVASDDKQAQSTVLAGVTGTVIVSFRTPPGLVGWITSFRQAWDAALDPNVVYSLRINGVRVNNYNGLSVQIAQPSADVDLPTPIRVEQLSLVEMVADNNSASNGSIVGRIVAKYYNP